MQQRWLRWVSAAGWLYHVLPTLPVWGPYHMVHDSVVQLVDSTWYAEERGEEQACHRVEKFVLCAPSMRHAGFPAFDRNYSTMLTTDNAPM